MADKTSESQVREQSKSRQEPSAEPAVTGLDGPPAASPVRRLPQILQRAQSNIGTLDPAEFRTLQRAIGNGAVARQIGRAKQNGTGVAGVPARSAPLGIQCKWGDADSGAYPAPTQPGQLPTPAGGWNASNQTIGAIERIPVEGLKQGLQTEVDGATKATTEGEAGKAIAVVPTTLKPNQPVEILLHLHGHNIGYRERAEKSNEKGMEQGTVRDVAADRIEQQIGAAGRNMIGILPQGTTSSGFGKFDADAYINEVWGVLSGMKKLPPGATRGSVVLSGHSGAASPIVTMLNSGKLPAGLGELVLFDAIHAGQLEPVEKFLSSRMAADLAALRDLADPAKNGGLDAAAVVTQQKSYLAGSFRFRGIFTPKYNPQKKDEGGNPMWEDPATKKKPIYDTTKWEGYGVQYEPLQNFLKAWMDAHTKGLEAGVGAALRENYQVIKAGPGATHNTIMGANDNLQKALSALPGAAPASTPNPPAATPPAAKTGEIEPVPQGQSPTEVASTQSPAPEPGAGTVVQAKRSDSSAGLFARIQRQAAPGHPLSDAEQWEEDWNNHAAQQSYFAGSGRPTGSAHDRYNVLCPLYKAHGIPRPMIYMATQITTAHFYGFSTPAHTNLATALAAAESTLKAQGYATAPVTSVWALNPRTTSTGAWSNHADGKAVDLDPDSNPHLIDPKERKIITEVTGTDMEEGAQGYDVMKGASDKFRADYNPAGLQRRITELKAAEDARKTERDTATSERDALKAQRDTLKSERDALRKELKAVPAGKKATADDVAKAADLKNQIQQKEADLAQAGIDIKSKETEIKQKENELKQATKDRELLEKELAKYEATEKAVSDLESAVGSLPDEIKTLNDQIAQSKNDEEDARNANDAAAIKAQQQLRARLQKASNQKTAELKKKQKELDKKKKARDEDPLRQYAGGGFLNLPKDVVSAMTGAGLKWGGNWSAAKDFMHFEL